MRGVIVALMLGGCFSPQPATGIPCAAPGSSARCPAGLVCVSSGGIDTCERPGSSGDDAGPDSTIDDAPIDMGPIIDACATCLDTDVDEIADVDDNCPQIANKDQSNEDGDGFGDVCDPCPVNPDNTDTDGDGVGNFCDPSGSTVDHIVQFVSFTNGTLPAGWATEGSVTLAGGEATLTAPAGSGAYITFASPTTSFVATWANMTFIAFDGAALAGMGVMDRRQAGTDNTLACQLVGNGAGTTHDIRLYEVPTMSLLDSADHPMMVNTASLVRMNREGGTNYRCSATAPFAEITAPSTFDPANEQIGVRVRSGTAKVRWIMVITR